ncbi:MAG TPA: phosphotransferase [Rubrobacter sp.]|nr:phosphotransferase [Rubrobacter sp.]
MSPLSLPDFPDVTTETLQEISLRHGLDTNTFSLLPQVGIFNLIYVLGEDFVLRVPRDHPISAADARKESVAVPAAREAGVRTPRIIAFDDALDLLPVPYTIYERVRGETLGLLPRDPAETPEVWRELGHDLALLHSGVAGDGPAAGIQLDEMPDPRPWPDELAEEGYFTATEARWLAQWLEHLASAALTPVSRRFLHGDSQSTNVMVREGSLEYLAVLDWGSSGWGDPAWDFAGVPLRVVPSMLEGYRTGAPLEDGVVARILWRHLQLSLYLLRRDPQPGSSWAERPLGMLLDVMRFLLDSPGPEWSKWTP